MALSGLKSQNVIPPSVLANAHVVSIILSLRGGGPLLFISSLNSNVSLSTQSLSTKSLIILRFQCDRFVGITTNN